MASILILRCLAAQIFDSPECDQLMAEYAAECANALIGKPAPRRDMYENLEACGMGQCFAAYEGGRLVGFSMVLVAVVPHYSLSCANTESLFVSKSASCGGALMERVEQYARSRGCTAIFHAAPVGSRFAKLLFLQEDLYTNVGHVFCRSLVQ